MCDRTKRLQFALILLLLFLLSCGIPDVSQRSTEERDVESVPTDAATGGTTRDSLSSPEVARVKVTYSGGDAVGGPQTLTGKDDATGIFLTGIHTVNIDFVNLTSADCVGDPALAAVLQPKNPITAIHVLELNTVDPPTSGGNHIRWGNISIDGKLYDVLFSNFQEKTSVKDLMVQTSADAKKTPKTNIPADWDGYVLSRGRFYVIQTTPRQVRLNCPGVVDLEITIVRGAGN